MKEARLVLPNKACNGVCTAATLVCLNAVAEKFGGYTQTLGSGLWVSPDGERIAEPVRIVDIAMEENEANGLALYDIADAFREAAKQEAVYVRYASGNVQFVSARSCYEDSFDWEQFRKDIHRDADLLSDVPEVPEHVSVAP